MGIIKTFNEFINESIWSDIQDRSMGKTVRKEDYVNNLDRNDFYDYLKKKYNKFTHLISKDPSEIHIKLGWSYFPQRDYIIDIHWVEKNEIKNLYLNFGPCELNTLCHKNFKIGTSNDGISNEEILNIIDFCLDYISSHKEIESPLNESIWSDIQDRSMGKTVREEDKITTNEDLQKKIQELYKKQGEGETLDVSSLTDIIKCDDFSNIFKGYPRVKHIIGLEDWDVSNVKNMNSMFMGCNNFSSDLSKWNVSSVGDMAAMFWGCNNFNSDLSKWNVSSVGDMDSMFWNCQTFNSDLSKWNVSSVEYMGNMFDGCKNFYSDLSKWNVSKVMSMQYMFQDCENFNSDLSKWDVSNVGNMECMFDGCKSLKKIPSWYMNEGLNESIWSDMQDRSTGETVREEDKFVNQMDYDEFFKYIYTNYLPLGNHNDYSIDRFIPRDQLDIVVIQMPLENIGIIKQPYILTIKINKDLDKIVFIRISSRLMQRYPDISKHLGDKYIISDTYTIKPVSGKITNYMCLDVIDKLLSMVENPLFKRINYEKVK